MKQFIAFILIGSAGLVSALAMANGQVAHADIAVAQAAAEVPTLDMVAAFDAFGLE